MFQSQPSFGVKLSMWNGALSDYLQSEREMKKIEAGQLFCSCGGFCSTGISLNRASAKMIDALVRLMIQAF